MNMCLAFEITFDKVHETQSGFTKSTIPATVILAK
jgi:hypothetical protein